MNVFILHPSPLQARIWQKILQSQDWTATIFESEADLQQGILSSELEGNNPKVILVSEVAPQVNLKQFGQWVAARPTAIAIIILANTANQRSITSTERQLAKAKGAYELLPEFSENTIAIEAINGLKCVAAAAGDLSIQNSALVSCIVDLKREFEQSNSSSPASTAATKANTPRPNSAANNPANDAPTKVRKYRGRDY